MAKNNSKIETKLKNFFDYNIDVDRRLLYYGMNSSVEVSSSTDSPIQEVNDWSSEQLIKGLSYLDDLNHKTITIIWNSDGGFWDSGIGVYEFIRTMKSPVKMICYSRCRSMGSVILQACKKRILTKNCRFMIHYGREAVDEVHSKDFKRIAEEAERINEIMERIYLSRIKEKHPRFTLQKLRELMKYDCYMSADEAVRLGLADEVI